MPFPRHTPQDKEKLNATTTRNERSKRRERRRARTHTKNCAALCLALCCLFYLHFDWVLHFIVLLLYHAWYQVTGTHFLQQLQFALFSTLTHTLKTSKDKKCATLIFAYINLDREPLLLPMAVLSPLLLISSFFSSCITIS